MEIKKYIRFSQHEQKFYYCLVDDKDRRFNKEHGEIQENQIPDDIRLEAVNRSDIYPSWVLVE